jgi:hypothetical protein
MDASVVVVADVVRMMTTGTIMMTIATTKSTTKRMAVAL